MQDTTFISKIEFSQTFYPALLPRGIQSCCTSKSNSRICACAYRVRIVSCVCVSGGKKCLFFGDFGVLCFLETPVLRFALLPYSRRNYFQLLNRLDYVTQARCCVMLCREEKMSHVLEGNCYFQNGKKFTCF